MKIQMLSTMAGPDQTILSGETADVSEALGRSLVTGGFAKEIVVEHAVVEAPETATLPVKKRGRK